MRLVEEAKAGVLEEVVGSGKRRKRRRKRESRSSEVERRTERNQVQVVGGILEAATGQP